MCEIREFYSDIYIYTYLVAFTILSHINLAILARRKPCGLTAAFLASAQLGFVLLFSSSLFLVVETARGNQNRNLLPVVSLFHFILFFPFFFLCLVNTSIHANFLATLSLLSKRYFLTKIGKIQCN